MNKGVIQLANKLVGTRQKGETTEAYARRIRETYDSLQRTVSNAGDITEINAEITALTLRIGSIEQEIETISGLAATQRLYQLTDQQIINNGQLNLITDAFILDLHSLISVSLADTTQMVHGYDYLWEPATQTIRWINGSGEMLTLGSVLKLNDVFVITYLR